MYNLSSSDREQQKQERSFTTGRALGQESLVSCRRVALNLGFIAVLLLVVSVCYMEAWTDEPTTLILAGLIALLLLFVILRWNTPRFRR